jgi:hypothetical protein
VPIDSTHTFATVKLSLLLTMSKQSKHPARSRGNGRRLNANSALAPHCGIGFLGLSRYRRKAAPADARSFPSSATSLYISTQSHQAIAVMSFRAGLRFFNAFRQQAAHTGKPMAQRSAYSSAAGTNASIPGPPQSRLQQLWSSPVGPKTVHFWAPIMKWGLVLAGAADFARPVESLSLSQNGALMATGLIWTRWCFVIKPRNLLYVHSTCLLSFCMDQC